MKDIKLAVPTKGEGGLEDSVSEVFGRAKTFTIINIDDNEVKEVEVLQNPAAAYKHGAGPVVVKTLTDIGVNAIIAGEFGPGVSTLLDHFEVDMIEIKRGTPVSEAVKKLIEKQAPKNQ